MNRKLETIPNQTAEVVFNAEANSRPRILVAEDDVDLRHLVMKALLGAGYDVDDADNGAHAWKALHLKRYDLLVTDHEMPEMTGLQLIDKLRSARFELPIILVSGSLLSDVVANSAWARTIATLSKPFTLDELRWKVEQLLPVLPAGFHPPRSQPAGHARSEPWP